MNYSNHYTGLESYVAKHFLNRSVHFVSNTRLTLKGGSQ